MNYEKIYDQLIQKFKKYKTRYEALKYYDYVEKHHIIPKCLGGTDEKDNLVFLSGRAHFMAHYLLSKIYPNDRNIWLAIQIMSHGKGGSYERYTPSSRVYEIARKKCGELFKGSKMSEEAKAKISKHSKNQVHTEERRKRAGESIKIALAKKKELDGGKKSPARLAADAAQRGKKMSDEARKKMSKSGKGRIFTEEHRANLAKSRIGKTHSQEAKDNMKKAHFNRFMKAKIKER